MGESLMSLSDAIQHCKESIERMKQDGTCKECINEHRQLVRWLEELEVFRNTSKKHD